MINYKVIIDVLQEVGFTRLKEPEFKKITFYNHEVNEYLYVNKLSPTVPKTLIIHPKNRKILFKLINIKGVINTSIELHGVSMKQFPKKIKGGSKPSSYGIPFGF